MFRHHLTMALRRLAREPLTSALTVVVLALGLTCFISAYLFVSYFRSYDEAFANVDRAYVLSQRMSTQVLGIDTPSTVASALPLGERVRLDVPELAAVARYYRAFVSVSTGREASPRLVGYVEPGFFEIFDFVPRAGDLRGALAAPRTAVLTESIARSMFGRDESVGRTVTVNGSRSLDVTVTAVIPDIPATSHLSKDGLFTLGFDLLVSWDVFEAVGKGPFIDSWGNTPATTYVLLPEDGSITVAELDRRLATVAERHVPPASLATTSFSFRALPVSSIAATNLQRAFQGFDQTGWRLDVLGTLLTLAAVVLVIGCLNFVNLATAQSSARGLDVGVRKTLGANATQIVHQDLTHTALIVAIATLVALAAIPILRRLMVMQWQLPLSLPWHEPRFWLFMALLLVGVTLFAGLYAAVALARVRPVFTLRTGSARTSPKRLRALLVGAQFSTAGFLIAMVAVLLAQSTGLREQLLGRFAHPYVTFFVGPPAAIPDRELLAGEIARGPGIEGVAYVWQPLWLSAGPRIQLTRTTGEQIAPVTLDDQAVSYDYFTTLDVPVLAGRVFERDHADDVMPRTREEFFARQGRPRRVVIDRAASDALGFDAPEEAVGEMVHQAGSPNLPYEIVGVVETVTTVIRSRGSRGSRFMLDPSISNSWIVRLDKASVEPALAHVSRVLKVLAPDRVPPSFTFFDEAFENAYWTFTIANRVMIGLALFATAIAATGLLGMASYLTGQRTREIGVRKSQGATSSDILRLLLWDFAKPVLAANVIAWPFVYFAAERYLGLFTQRAAFDVMPLALALLITLFLAYVAVGRYSARAARALPAVALRREA